MTQMLRFCAGLPVGELPTGEVLIEEGAAPGPILILAGGSVNVERDGVAFARIDSPGSVFGEMSWILHRPATATVRATAPVTYYRIGDPETFFTEQPGAALEVLRMTASRLDGLTQYLVDVKRQFAGMEGHLGMVEQILNKLVHHQAPAPRTGSARDPEG